MRKIVLIFFIFFISIVNCQNNLDSLLERLSTTKTDSLKEELYYKIIKESFSISVDSGYNQAKKFISVNVEENNYLWRTWSPAIVDSFLYPNPIIPLINSTVSSLLIA